MFLSASPSIFPLLQKYYQTKLEAENHLLTDENCLKAMNSIILRPGLVWHPSERKVSVPLKILNDIGYQINQAFGNVNPLLPQNHSISLSTLSDYAI